MMKTADKKAIARGIIRNGSWLVPQAHSCSLADIEAIERLVLFPITLTRCELTGWELECPDIQQERSNSFWWGQEAGPAAVEEPTKWIRERQTTPKADTPRPVEPGQYGKVTLTQEWCDVNNDKQWRALVDYPGHELSESAFKSYTDASRWTESVLLSIWEANILTPEEE
jgi:hypothetical protein